MKKLLLCTLCLLTALTAFAQAGMWVGVKNIRIEKKSKTVVFRASAEYPFTDDSVVANAIREWMNENLGGSYTGSLQEPEAMLDYYADLTVRELSDPEMAAYGTSEETYKFSRGHETPQIITYQMTGYSYSAGATHGMPRDTYTTFRKSDGRRFGWDMFTEDGKTRLKAILASKLRVDYGDDTFFKVPDAKDPEFQLPETAPYLTADGVVFSYPPYAIAPYAAGYITVTLPITMVKGMINATGQTFFI